MLIGGDASLGCVLSLRMLNRRSLSDQQPYRGVAPISCFLWTHFVQETLTGATPLHLVLAELRKIATEADSIERRLGELVDSVYALVVAIREKD